MAEHAMSSGEFDSPWRRLPVTLPLAIFVCVMGAVAFVLLLGIAKHNAVAADTIDAQIVELAPPAPVVKRTQPALPKTSQPAVAPEPKTAPEPSVPPTPPAPVTPAGNIKHVGPRAIFKPLPVIPDELRTQFLETVAVVRFTVAADGSATVQLLRATPDPRLNRLLLEAYRRWRFFPAVDDQGRPIESTVDIRVSVKVD